MKKVGVSEDELTDDGLFEDITNEEVETEEERQELCDTIAIIHQGEVVTCQPKEELIASLDSKVLMIVPEEELKEAPQMKSGYQAELREDGSLYVHYKPSETKVADILADINAANISVKDLSTVEADLEDVFMELTYGSDG